jgi:hypothetical protein
LYRCLRLGWGAGLPAPYRRHAVGRKMQSLPKKRFGSLNTILWIAIQKVAP